MNLIELCRRLAAIDSSIVHGTQDIVEFVSGLAREWGLDCDVQEEAFNGVSHANVFVRPAKRAAKKELVLMSRLDTTEPGEYARWVRTGANPFNASIDGDLIYGLGLADAKADFACKLLALKSFGGRIYDQVSPVVVGTYGHASGAGAIRMIRKKSVHACGVLVGAPTELQLATSGPGYAKVEIAIPFSTAEREYHEKHDLSEGSVSQSKVFTRQDRAGALDLFESNPIVKLMEYLKNLPSGMTLMNVDGGGSSEAEPDSAFLEVDVVDGLQDGMIGRLVQIGEALKRLSTELKSVSAEGCEPPFSTMTLGRIRTSPEEVRMTGICRLVPAGGRDVYRGWLEKLRQDCAATGATFHLVDYKPPFEAPLDGPFITFLKRVSSDLNFSPKHGAAQMCTEANVFQRLGVESVVFGPGATSLRSHASEEHVHVRDLERARDFYKKAIESYCQ